MLEWFLFSFFILRIQCRECSSCSVTQSMTRLNHVISSCNHFMVSYIYLFMCTWTWSTAPKKAHVLRRRLHCRANHTYYEWMRFQWMQMCTIPSSMNKQICIKNEFDSFVVTTLWPPVWVYYLYRLWQRHKWHAAHTCKYRNATIAISWRMKKEQYHFQSRRDFRLPYSTYFHLTIPVAE